MPFPHSRVKRFSGTIAPPSEVGKPPVNTRFYRRSLLFGQVPGVYPDNLFSFGGSR